MNKRFLIKLFGMAAAITGSIVCLLSGDYTQAVAILGASLTSVELVPK